MRKVIVFFNSEEPYALNVDFTLKHIRLQYPNGNVADLPIMVFQAHNNARKEEYYIASDRELEQQEVIDAITSLH